MEQCIAWCTVIYMQQPIEASCHVQENMMTVFLCYAPPWLCVVFLERNGWEL